MWQLLGSSVSVVITKNKVRRGLQTLRISKKALLSKDIHVIRYYVISKAYPIKCWGRGGPAAVISMNFCILPQKSLKLQSSLASFWSCCASLKLTLSLLWNKSYYNILEHYIGFLHRIIEYPDLGGTHKDHPNPNPGSEQDLPRNPTLRADTWPWLLPLPSLDQENGFAKIIVFMWNLLFQPCIAQLHWMVCNG